MRVSGWSLKDLRGKSEVPSSLKQTRCGLLLSNTYCGAVWTVVVVIVKVTPSFCFDENSSWLVMRLPSFILLSWPGQWVFFVMSCVRLARTGEPPQAPSPSTPTASSYALFSCPVQACIIYPPACLPAYASWSAPLSIWVYYWTGGQIMLLLSSLKALSSGCYVIFNIGRTIVLSNCPWFTLSTVSHFSSAKNRQYKPLSAVG